MGNKGQQRQRAWAGRLGAAYEGRFSWLWAEGYRSLGAMRSHWPVDHGRPGEPPCPDVSREPSAGTFKNRIRDYREREGVPWRFAKASAVEAAAIMPVLGALLEHSEGRLKTFTTDEAATLGRIRAAAPGLDPWLTYRVAHRYALGTEDDQESLEALIGFAPWQSPEAMERFLRWTIDHRVGWLAARRVIRKGDTVLTAGPGRVLHRHGAGGEPHVHDRGNTRHGHDPETATGRVETFTVARGLDVSSLTRSKATKDALSVWPVRPGQPVPKDPVGVTAGVVIALEIRAAMKGGTA